MSELLPCPFCGGPGMSLRGSDGYQVQCVAEGCEAEGPYLASYDLAETAWNRRTPPPLPLPLPTREDLINVFRNHIRGGLFEGSPQVSGFDDAADAVLRLLGGEKNDA